MLALLQETNILNNIYIKKVTTQKNKYEYIYTEFVRKVMSMSRLKKIYRLDRYNTLKGFKIVSSCDDIPLPATFPGIKGVTVGLFRNVL